MYVYKFGGTSVGSPSQMKKVAMLITSNEDEKIVVLSAVSGTTNQLIAIANTAMEGSRQAAESMIGSLKSFYLNFIEELYSSKEKYDEASIFINQKFKEISSLIEVLDGRTEKRLSAQGELISTQLFYLYMKELNVPSALIPALEFMRIDANDEPDIPLISSLIQPFLTTKNVNFYITQGYICRDINDKIDNLKRGGSDYTASLIGAAINSEEVQIWTDIDGMHNNDPRIVNNTYPIAELTFDEAAELAYFGAKILHPSSILPAQKYNIPVRLKSTMDENAVGTLISSTSERGKVKAIAAKDGIIAIKIKSSRMLLAYGFMRRVFEVFERNKTSIDMITTSEVAVSLTIDNSMRLAKIIEELKQFGHVETDTNQTIICVVGNMITEDDHILANVFASMHGIPIRMVSYGGSRYNISMLVSSELKEKALNQLNNGLFITS